MGPIGVHTRGTGASIVTTTMAFKSRSGSICSQGPTIWWSVKACPAAAGVEQSWSTGSTAGWKSFTKAAAGT